MYLCNAIHLSKSFLRLIAHICHAALHCCVCFLLVQLSNVYTCHYTSHHTLPCLSQSSRLTFLLLHSFNGLLYIFFIGLHAFSRYGQLSHIFFVFVVQFSYCSCMHCLTKVLSIILWGDNLNCTAVFDIP